MIKEGGWNVKWQEQQQVPYMYKDNVWVGYDDVKSVEIKVDYAKSQDLGGVMVWSIETDDFRGKCGAPYPILTTINQALGKVT